MSSIAVCGMMTIPDTRLSEVLSDESATEPIYGGQVAYLTKGLVSPAGKSGGAGGAFRRIEWQARRDRFQAATIGLRFPMGASIGEGAGLRTL